MTYRILRILLLSIKLGFTVYTAAVMPYTSISDHDCSSGRILGNCHHGMCKKVNIITVMLDTATGVAIVASSITVETVLVADITMLCVLVYCSIVVDVKKL